MDRPVAFIEKPVELTLDRTKHFVKAEVTSENEVFVFAFTVPAFIESFGRAALLAHQWRVSENGEVIELAMFRDRN